MSKRKQSTTKWPRVHPPGPSGFANGAYAGTYTVDGNEVTHRVVAAYRRDRVGRDQIRFVELSGRQADNQDSATRVVQTWRANRIDTDLRTSGMK